MRIVLAVAAAVAAARSLPGDQWTDPGFEEMVERSSLIAVIEVVEGGKFECAARAVEVLKGKDPGKPFRMAGYNNEHWPPEGIEEESMEKGDRLLAFLDGVEGTWYAPSPSCGDDRIIDGKLHGSWYDPSYPHGDPGVDAGLVLGLVRGYLLHLEKKPPVEARKLIARNLTVDLARSVAAPRHDDDDGENSKKKARDPKEVEEEKANAARAARLDWLLCAQAAYGEESLAPAILEAARSKHLLVKICAARALRSAGRSKEVLGSLGGLLLADHSFVQAEAARSLAASFRREEAVPLLLKAVPTSSGNDGGSRRVMDPLLNRTASGREMMVRALTRLGAEKEAHDELVKLIRDDGLTEGVFLALADHFVKHPSAKAREKFIELYGRCPEEAVPLFHLYLLREKSPEALRAVAARIRREWDDTFRQLRALEDFAVEAPPGEPLLRETVLELFRGNRIAMDELLPFAVPAAGDEVRKFLGNFPKDKLDEEGLASLELVEEAVALKLSPPAGGRERIDRWLDLIRRFEETSGSTEGRRLLHRELVRSVPPDLRTYAVGKIRAGIPHGIRWMKLEAIRDLGGEMSDEEKESLAAVQEERISP